MLQNRGCAEATAVVCAFLFVGAFFVDWAWVADEVTYLVTVVTIGAAAVAGVWIFVRGLTQFFSWWRTRNLIYPDANGLYPVSVSELANNPEVMLQALAIALQKQFSAKIVPQSLTYSPHYAATDRRSLDLDVQTGGKMADPFVTGGGQFDLLEDSRFKGLIYGDSPAFQEMNDKVEGALETEE